MILKAEVDEKSIKMSVCGDMDDLKFATVAIINGIAESIAKQSTDDSEKYLDWVENGIADAVKAIDEKKVNADDISELIDKLTDDAAKDILKAIGEMLK